MISTFGFILARCDFSDGCLAMNRTPPSSVRKQLRKEVGFGCPVPGCQNPFLEWHHFDPKWNEREHHEPEGMIALCSVHHRQADVGTFTQDQLRQFKTKYRILERNMGSRFEWMRNKILIHIGGNHYLETYEILKLKGQRIIWLTRDEDGYLMLNIRPLSTSQEPRFGMEENFWLVHGNQEDLECPPSGRLIRITYPNGDKFSVEFRELEDETALRKRYPNANANVFDIETPITAIEIMYRLAGTSLDFGPDSSQIGGVQIRGGFVYQCGTVFSVG